MTELFEFQDEALPPRKRPWRVPVDADLPPAPPGTRYVRLLGLGRVIADDDLRRRVEHFFYWPMIILSLAVLPLLIIELNHPEDRAELFVDVGFAVIWFAFLAEFVSKIAIAESRIEYVRINWLDLVIIVVPVLRALRLTSMVRMVRLFKLRGVAFKIARTVMTLFVTFQVADRLLRRLGVDRPERPAEPVPESMTRHALMKEIRRRRRRQAQWDAWFIAHRRWLDERGLPTPEAPAPEPAEESPS